MHIMAVVARCAGLGPPESSSRGSGLGANQVRTIPGTTLRAWEREANNSASKNSLSSAPRAVLQVIYQEGI